MTRAKRDMQATAVSLQGLLEAAAGVLPRLSEPESWLGANADVNVSSITADSRRVQPGSLFVAVPGVRVDGRDYIEAAIKAGACAVLSTPDAANRAEGVPFIASVHPRRALARLAAALYAPKQPTVEAAITGTNGKTSVAEFLRQIWAFSGRASASIGTLGVRSNGFNTDSGLTTPDPSTLMAQVGALAAKGVSHLAVEASSHGLDQHRLDGMQFSVAAFTNLSRDHLDYHATEDAYFFAKARLFGELLPPYGAAVLHADDARSQTLADILWSRGIHTVLVGRSNKAADIRLTESHLEAGGQSLTISVGGAEHHVFLPLLGDFQADNFLVALGVAIETGVSLEHVLNAASQLKGVPGRMEYAGETATGGKVVLDFAHTPAGLETVLRAARKHTSGRVAVVFGCGGDRDKGKRPQMGAIAHALADAVYVTDDNPRSEDAATIRSEIMVACDGAHNIADRTTAVRTAIADLRAGDILIVAGKGHETGQIIGDQTIPYSDHEAVYAALQACGGQAHKGVVAC